MMKTASSQTLLTTTPQLLMQEWTLSDEEDRALTESINVFLGFPNHVLTQTTVTAPPSPQHFDDLFRMMAETGDPLPPCPSDPKHAESVFQMMAKTGHPLPAAPYPLHFSKGVPICTQTVKDKNDDKSSVVVTTTQPVVAPIANIVIVSPQQEKSVSDKCSRSKKRKMDVSMVSLACMSTLSSRRRTGKAIKL